MLWTLAFTLMFSYSYALLFGDIKWDGMSVRWGLNPLLGKNFDRMPRTVAAARLQGFRKISDCDLAAEWRGQRFVKDDDYALILLYDINGFIAGIQTSIPDDQVNGYPHANLQPPFVTDGDRYTITAYFVDPSLICTRGRSISDFVRQGTGTNLYLQNTTDPEASTLIPRRQSRLRDTGWLRGGCFIYQGLHYFYDITSSSTCDGLFPVSLLYNRGQLTGFSWVLLTDLTSSRYEHPPVSVIRRAIRDPPQCLFETSRISSMHIYLTDTPLNVRC